MSRRSAAGSKVATFFLVLCTALVIAGIALAIANHGARRISLGSGLPWWFGLENCSAALIYIIPGWYLAKKRPDVPFGWLALAAGLGHALAAAGFEYSVFAVLGGHHVSAPWVGLWFAAWGPTVELPVLASIYALFPDARRPTGRLGALAVVASSVVTVGVVAGLVDPVLVVSPKLAAIAALHNPFALHLGFVHTIDGPPTFAPGMIAATVVLVIRWRRSDEASRQVLSWLAPTAIAAFVIAAPAASFAGWVGIVAAQVVSIVEVAVITAAVLRQRVFGIVVVLNRTLVYLSLTVGLALVYVATVAVAANIAGQGTSSAIGAIVAALVVTPGRERVQRGVNRFLYGQRDEPYAVLSAVGERLATATSPEELLQGFVEEVSRSLRVPYLCLELVPGNERFEVGEPLAHDTFEVRHEGRLLGNLLAGHRSGEPEISVSEQRLYRQLADHASVAVANYSLTVDLRRSRERIVTAREEERRRLRRDLHDGLGPQLTGIALGLDAAADVLVPIAPQQASSLEMLRGELGDAIVDIRRLVHDLRPPSLDELGLLGVIGELVERASRGGLSVTLDAGDGVPELPAAVEVAALRITSEAINNVVRHAHATTCRVELRVDDAALAIRVEDDGRGFTADSRAGVGTGSMRERAEEVGGTCLIESREAGGVSVDIRLPLGGSDG